MTCSWKRRKAKRKYYKLLVEHYEESNSNMVKYWGHHLSYVASIKNVFRVVDIKYIKVKQISIER
jgi:hypothetical protein